VSGIVELADESDVVITEDGNEVCCLGETVACAGDADGLDDVLVEWTDYLGDAKILLFLSPSAERMTGDYADAWWIRGATNNEMHGLACPGDTDGDGYPDVAIGNTSDQDGAYYGGAALVYRGMSAGGVDMDAPDAKLTSGRCLARAGTMRTRFRTLAPLRARRRRVDELTTGCYLQRQPVVNGGVPWRRVICRKV
jgi:hypothetical protein